MKTKNTIGVNYTPPLCTIADIAPEGVLCTSFGSSIEKLGNDVVYNWGDEE